MLKRFLGSDVFLTPSAGKAVRVGSTLKFLLFEGIGFVFIFGWGQLSLVLV